MNRIILISDKESRDADHMMKLLKLATELNHPHGQACCSGDPLEFQIEEKFLTNGGKNSQVMRLDPQTGKLMQVDS